MQKVLAFNFIDFYLPQSSEISFVQQQNTKFGINKTSSKNLAQWPNSIQANCLLSFGQEKIRKIEI